jgi:hypothetical protein
MSLEASGRFGVRGAVSGFVVNEPSSRVRDGIARLKQGSADLLAQAKAKAAVSFPKPVSATPEMKPVTSVVPDVPAYAGPDHDTSLSIPSPVPPSQVKQRLATAWVSASYACLLTASLARMGFADAQRWGLARFRSLRASPLWQKAVAHISSTAIWAWDHVSRYAAARFSALPLPARSRPASLVAGLGLAFAVLILLIPKDSPVPPEPAMRAAVPAAPVWRDIVRPLAVFNLEGGTLSGNVLTYRAFARNDGAREDVMSWASPKQPKMPVGVVVVHRHPPNETTEQRLFSETARRAASFGLSLEGAGHSNAIATKFGDLEVMDVRLKDESGEQACIAFRHIAWSAPLAFTGWRCGTAEKPIDRPQLVCFIDRLDVMSAGQELWLRDYFADSERFRSFCASRRVTAGKVQQDKTMAAPVLRRDVTGTVKDKTAPKREKARSSRKKGDSPSRRKGD